MTRPQTEGPWAELVASALVGTGRRPQLPPSLSADMLAVGAGPLSPEEKLLAAAALLGPARRATPSPVPDVKPLPECPEDEDQEQAPAAAVQVMELLLGDTVAVLARAELIAEWLSEATASGKRLPYRLLPGVLNLVSGRPALVGPAWGCLGARGRWLARVNPSWSPAVPQELDELDESNLEQAWATAAPARRAELLRRLRNRRPAQARQLLAEAFPKEQARQRAELLSTLGVALSDDDEELIEETLDDRSGAVREVAVGLLDRLPASRRAERLAGRAVGLVAISGGKQPKLVTRLPEELDDAALRDGTSLGRPARKGQGAWWFHRTVSGAPLATWPQHLSLPPARLALLAAGNLALLDAWAAAAVAQADAEWAMALLPAHLPAWPALLPVLAPAVAVEAVAHRLARPNEVAPYTALAILSALPGPWDPGFSQTVLAWCRGQAGRLGTPGIAGLLGARLSPAPADDEGSWRALAGEGQKASTTVRQLQYTLALRQAIKASLGPATVGSP